MSFPPFQLSSTKSLVSSLTNNHGTEEKIQKQNLQREADFEFEESERLRRERKAKYDRAKEAARKAKREAEAQHGQNGHACRRV